MDTTFVWRTANENQFKKNVSFTYGDSRNVPDLALWNSVHESLEINVNLDIIEKSINYKTLISEGEKAGVILQWIGDRKFNGCSSVSNFDFVNPANVKCIIPKGSCVSVFVAKCYLIITTPTAKRNSDWFRPPGSIISEISIVDNSNIGKGSWFPIEEYDGDGSILLKWDFANAEDLNSSVSANMIVLIDRKHPILSGTSQNKFSEALLNLKIIQDYVRKAFSENIYEQLYEQENEEKFWEAGSLGESWTFVLKKLCSFLKISSIKGLRELYLQHPEKIDEGVDNIFSKSLISILTDDTSIL